ncbi:MAG: glycosyltransferase [Opitutaceae bacterium]
MVDNNWHGSIRQIAGMLVFRAFMRRHFDRVIVPGSEGVRFMRLMGMPRERIYTRMYGADPDLFNLPSESLSNRPKRIVFVGQMIERKGVREMLEAWKRSGSAGAGWELRCFGRGPLEPLLAGVPGVFNGGFAQAERLASELRNARVLILPSREEHWGVVVHEAALCGCALAISSAVGAGADLVEPANGFIFPPGKPQRIAEVFGQICSKTAEWYDNANTVSTKVAENFGPTRWAEMFDALVADLFGH